jgi:hypothetical protein
MLAVAPMFLRSNKRIAALITVICLALLIPRLIRGLVAVGHFLQPVALVGGQGYGACAGR